MPSRINIGPEDGPYVAINESSGNLQLEDNSGNVVAEWDDGESQWDFVENDISGVGAFDSESVNTERASIETLEQVEQEDGTDVSDSRAFDETYQNVDDETLKLAIRLEAGTGEDLNVRLGVSSNENDVTETHNTVDGGTIRDIDGSNARMIISAMVPPGYYYHVVSFGDETIMEWNERRFTPES